MTCVTRWDYIMVAMVCLCPLTSSCMAGGTSICPGPLPARAQQHVVKCNSIRILLLMAVFASSEGLSLQLRWRLKRVLSRLKWVKSGGMGGAAGVQGRCAAQPNLHPGGTQTINLNSYSGLFLLSVRWGSSIPTRESTLYSPICNA